jgi:hypothetical protein
MCISSHAQSLKCKQAHRLSTWLSHGDCLYMWVTPKDVFPVFVHVDEGWITWQHPYLSDQKFHMSRLICFNKEKMSSSSESRLHTFTHKKRSKEQGIDCGSYCYNHYPLSYILIHDQSFTWINVSFDVENNIVNWEPNATPKMIFGVIWYPKSLW